MKKLVLLMVLLTLLLTACGTPEPLATPQATASLLPQPTITLTLSPTPLQPTATATPVLIDGTLNIKVNVRTGPGTGYDSLGQLESGTKVQVAARDTQGTWFLILFPAAPQGRGWVASQYVTVAADSEIPLDATPTPSGPTGSVVQRLNVRGGPGTAFDSLGMLEPGVVVTLTGKNATASWFQLDFPAGPGGRGWVTSQYIQTDDTADLPVLDDSGNPVTPAAAGTASGPLILPTPTVGPAYPDSDSSVNPAVRISFSSTGTHRFTYSSQVSAPEGDGQDWVEFTPYTTSGTIAHLNFSLACAGNGTLVTELWQGGTPLSNWSALACGDVDRSFLLKPGLVYQVRLAPAPADGLRLVDYTLTVENSP
jgi:uncharacterized protein YraI